VCFHIAGAIVGVLCKMCNLIRASFQAFGVRYSSDLRASGSLRVVGWFVVDVSGQMSKEKSCFLHILAVEHGNDMLSRDIGDEPTQKSEIST
jgi:hypothetical protein